MRFFQIILATTVLTPSITSCGNQMYSTSLTKGLEQENIQKIRRLLIMVHQALAEFSFENSSTLRKLMSGGVRRDLAAYELYVMAEGLLNFATQMYSRLPILTRGSVEETLFKEISKISRNSDFTHLNQINSSLNQDLDEGLRIKVMDYTNTLNRFRALEARFK